MKRTIVSAGWNNVLLTKMDKKKVGESYDGSRWSGSLFFLHFLRNTRVFLDFSVGD
jgi:hypothetical protein